MSRQEATRIFRGKDRLNCAQAITRAFRPETTAAEIKALKKAGFGKAENGECGAYYAARLLLADDERVAALKREFQRRCGSVNCRRIRRDKLVSCEECVAVAAGCLEQLLPEQNDA